MRSSRRPGVTQADDLAGLLLGELDAGALAATRAAVRWVIDAGIPFPSGIVLLLHDPRDEPVSPGDVAALLGIEVQDAVRALHQLRSLGYLREASRRYSSTDRGRRAHAALTAARRAALEDVLSKVGRDGRARGEDG